MPVKKSSGLVLLATACVMTNACGQPERPRTVSDFCLNAKRISAEPDPARVDQGEPSAEDDAPGNQYDTEQTYSEVASHNAAYDRLCSEGAD